MRPLIQALATVAQNLYLVFPWTRNIYQGGLKKYCVPGLNCHSCPSALFACPVGTLQHFLAGAKGAVRWTGYRLGFSVIGFLLAVGALTGRLTCGWLCPFGFLQESLHRIPSRKLRFPGGLGAVKYAVSILLVVVLPVALSRATAPGEPWYCKLLCPAGTLEAGPLFFVMPELLEQIGPIFLFKLMLLAGLLILAVFVFRPFCRLFCPLGLLYGLLNRVSLLGLRFEKEACEGCGECLASCRMGLDPRVADPDPECTRCFDCLKGVCPNGALSLRPMGSRPTSRDCGRIT